MIKLSVIAPCYNEAANIKELVHRVFQSLDSKSINSELILVNDASTDHTLEIVEALAQQFPRLKLISHESNLGMVAGWRSGIAESSGEFICLIDADLQNQPEDIYRLYREIINTRADMVQGFRSSIGRLKDSRWILSKGLNFILNTLFGMDLRDNKSGFVICRREVLDRILSHRLRYKYFQSFITVAAHANRYSIKEIETLFESRILGNSFIPKFPLQLVLRVLVDCIKAFWEYRLNFHPRTIEADILAESNAPNKQERNAGWRRAALRMYAATMPIHHWTISSRFFLHYQELIQTQWLAPEKIMVLQKRKLRRLLIHCYHHVPYYRELFNQLNLTPDDITNLSDLRKIPLLDKDTVRKNLYFDLLSDNHRKKDLLRISTSGSTGEPFVCFADRFQLEMRMAATLRGSEWAGYRFGDRQARLWHQTLGLSWSQIIREYADSFFCRRRFLPAYEMSEETIRTWIKEMTRYKPTFIDGYAESFNFLANYLERNKIVGFSPRGIMSSAQILPKQSREAIEKAFNCKVFDKYGSREFSGIAYECDAHQGHHVVAENFIVEILKDGQPALPGETGEIVITDLNNFSQPFIRYKIGDVAIAIDNSAICSCGRGLPRIGEIQGRLQSIIVGSNGSFMPGTFFAHLFKDYDYAIRQYQVIQHVRGEIELKIVQGLRFEHSIFELVLAHIREYLGTDLKIKTEFVNSIPLGRTGKRLGVISYLDINQELNVR